MIGFLFFVIVFFKEEFFLRNKSKNINQIHFDEKEKTFTSNIWNEVKKMNIFITNMNKKSKGAKKRKNNLPWIIFLKRNLVKSITI